MRATCAGPWAACRCSGSARTEGDDDWQLDQAAAGWLAEAADRVLNGEPVEAVHAALPVMDAAGRKVTAKMLRAASPGPRRPG